MNLSASSLRSLPKAQRDKFLASLSPAEAAALFYNWEFWARPEQLPPPGDWFVWLLRSGRGYGKTRTGAETVNQWARDFSPIALIGETKADVRDVMIELGESSLMKISPPWFMPTYEPSKRRLTWPNGAVGIAYSGDEPDQLRGPQHQKAWVDELAKFKYPVQTWDNLLYGLRIGKKPQAIVTTTPRPIKLIKELIADADTVDMQRSSYDNIDNLSPVYIRKVIRPREGTRLGRQEIGGEILEDAPGALWKRGKDIEAYRVIRAPELLRIVVAIDPSATSGGNEAGIVAAGLGIDKHGYVLSDDSMQVSPLAWAKQAIVRYNRLKADRIIAEVNHGGEMVETIIRQIRDEGDRPIGASIPYKALHASRGKQARAEPVAALYEQGRVHHVGMFAELEDELCGWEPNEGMPSPNRLDALVWALTDLMLEPQGVFVG